MWWVNKQGTIWLLLGVEQTIKVEDFLAIFLSICQEFGKGMGCNSWPLRLCHLLLRWLPSPYINTLVLPGLSPHGVLLLWMQHLCALPQTHPNSKAIVFGNKAFNRWLSQEGWVLMKKIMHYRKKYRHIIFFCSLLGENTRKGCLQSRRQALTRHQSCWHPGLGHASFQSYEK